MNSIVRPALVLFVALSAITAPPRAMGYASPSTIRKSRSAALPNTFNAAW